MPDRDLPEVCAPAPTHGDSDGAVGGVPPHQPRVRRSLEQSSDDTDEGWGERPDRRSHDSWLQEQRPPHWE